jgi:hypothetical protein
MFSRRAKPDEARPSIAKDAMVRAKRQLCYSVYNVITSRPPVRHTSKIAPKATRCHKMYWVI